MASWQRKAVQTMSATANPLSQMCAVTISREYGSGGGEIGARLAQRLGWQLIDHEIVVQVARELKISEAEAAEHDEYAESLLERILNNMRLVQPTVPVALPMVSLLPKTNGRAYHEALRRVVAAAAARCQVVIVGRGGQFLLRERRDMLHVRVVAPLESRIAYVMRREGMERAQAQERILLKDRDRLRYLHEHYQQDPTDGHLYDLVINTAILDLDSAVEIITLALARKGQRLVAPVEELGPAAGMARYPGQPGDFRPPGS